MAGVKRFEDLLAWQKSHELAKQIYNVITDGDPNRDYGLHNQIQRTAVSIISNIKVYC